MSEPIARAPTSPDLVTISLAEVRAHDRVMRYRCAGAGRHHLILLSLPGAALPWPALMEVLEERYRVLLPDLPDDETDPVRWLGDFLDGLGVHRVALVAAGAMCIPALELALLRPEQIERLVLVPGGDAEETGLDGTIATSASGAAVPLLVVRRGLAGAVAAPLVKHFLCGG